MKIDKGLAAFGVVVTILSVVGIWQADRVLSDEGLRVTRLCEVFGDRSDPYAALCQEARNGLAAWTVVFWLSLFFVVFGPIVILLSFSGEGGK